MNSGIASSFRLPRIRHPVTHSVSVQSRRTRMTGAPRTMTETPAATTPLEQALSRLQLGGAIFFRSEFTEAWSFSSPAAEGEFAHTVEPDADRLIMFHIVAKGSCWVAGPDGERHRANEGDVIVLPYGDEYEMGGDVGERPDLLVARAAAVDDVAGVAPRRRRQPDRRRLRISAFAGSPLRSEDAGSSVGVRRAAGRGGAAVGAGEHRLRARRFIRDRGIRRRVEAPAGTAPDRDAAAALGVGAVGRARLDLGAARPGSRTGARVPACSAGAPVDGFGACARGSGVAFALGAKGRPRA